MGLLLLSTVFIVSVLLCIPLLALALFILLWGYKMPLFGGCRSPDDLEKGQVEIRFQPKAEPAASEQENKGDPAVPRRFDWAEVESLTGNFAAEAVVGEGGSSTVYLARLPSSGTGVDESPLVAVKRHRPSERLHRAFRQELDAISRLRHPHIVSLLGYCDDLEGGVLLFEYSPNGNLHERIHGASEALSWAQRMAVAHKIALALEYLHEGCDPQIVHCDVKATNVLLDESFQPKLCDFGSAQVGFSSAVQPPSLAGRSAARQIVGSPGYVDPHYFRSGMISKKNDVYSFGVLLMELITGQEAFDPEREPQLLAASMRPVLKNDGDHDRKRKQLEEVIDKRFNGEFDAGEAALAAEVATMCVVDNPILRPSMTEVAQIFGEKMSSSILAVNCKADGKLKL